jgi:hypothetical protein
MDLVQSLLVISLFTVSSLLNSQSPHPSSLAFPPLLSVAPLFEALSKAALMNPDPPEDGENEGDDELIFDQTAFAAAGGASEEQVRKERWRWVVACQYR